MVLMSAETASITIRKMKNATLNEISATDIRI